MSDEVKAKKVRGPSRLDALRDAERRVREAEIELVKQKTENVRLENDEISRRIELQKLGEAAERLDKTYALSSDAANRTYNFIDDVNYRSSDLAVKTVGAWARQSPERIVVRFNSPGGGVFDGFALYDQLKAIDVHRTPITTVSTGMSASMAGILIQAGSRRLVAENTQFMIHEVSTVAWGKTSDIEDEAKFTRKLTDRLFSILASRSLRAFKAGTAKEGMTLEQVWEKAKRKDWWLDADEAVYFGIADEIGYL